MRFYTVKLKTGDRLYELRREGKQLILAGEDGVERSFATVAEVRRALGGSYSEISMTIHDSQGAVLLRSSF